ncbi:beta strand repeat-containing protein, partial [Sutterella wadsworthensis]|uniref:beta strand repeat-containing protein n=1 Tax=Sutterella wadsworthensis TaxID=40545 RepID=UPI0013F6159E
MNRNFKVVFSKARGALMVVNEATSSVQAKGTKTVIAAAVAALSLGAGVASAAPQTFKDVTLDAGDSLTVTSKKDSSSTTTVYTPAGTVTGTLSAGNKEGTFAAGDTIASKGSIYLNGGELVLTGTTTDAIVKADTKTGQTTSGTITLNADASNGKGISVTYDAIEGGTFSKLDLNLNVFNAETAKGTTGDVTIGKTGTALTLKEGTLKTGTIEGSSTADGKKVGTAKIFGDTLAFGEETKYLSGTGEVDLNNQGSAYNFDNAADVNLEIAAEKTATFNKGAITNAGKMTVSGKTGVTVGKQVSIANTGDLTFTDTEAVNFNADYTATAGRLFIESKVNTISGNITADSLKFGKANTDLTKETNQVVITATSSDSSATVTNTITYGSTVDVKALTVEDAATTVKGTLKAAATTIKTGGLTVEDADADNNKLAVVTLGDITVGSTDTKTAGSFTLTNTAKKAVEASSLTVVKNSKASSFTLAKGDFSVGKLTNQGTVTLGATDSSSSTVGKLIITGESTNESGATIAFNAAKDSLVVAEGASLQNLGTIGSDNAKGIITVEGTLTNAPAASGVKAGVIKAYEVEVDGVLSTALDKNYTVTTTNINASGELQTSLNGKIATANDALSIASTINLAGKITADGTEVQDYIVAKGGTFNLVADKTFNTVQVSGTFAANDADVTLSVLDVKKDGKATVNDGTLNVTTLQTVTGAAVSVNDGTLATSLTGLGLTYDAKKGFTSVAAGTEGAGKVAANTITLESGSLLDVDLGSVTEVETKNLDGLTKLVATGTSTGLIDIGATKIKDVEEAIKDGKIASKDLVAGVTNDTIKSVTVTDIAKDTISGKDAIYGAIDQGESSKAKNLTIDGVSLTLTGTGNIVYYTDTSAKVTKLSAITFGTNGGTLVTTGEGAQVGAVGTAAKKNGELYVKSGDLTANGDVNVKDLDVETGAKLSLAKNDAGTGYALTTGTNAAVISGELAAADSAVTFGSTATAAYADGAYSFKNVNQVTGKLAAKSLTLSGDMAVANGGVVVADTISAQDAKKTATTIFVGDSVSAGSLSVGELAAGSIYADPTWKEDGSAAAVSLVAVKKAASNTSVEADRSSIVSVGTNNVTAGTAAFAKTGFTLAKTDADKKQYSINTKTVNSVVYAEGAQYAGAVLADGNGTKNTDTKTSGVSIGANSMLLIDATKVDTTKKTSVFTQAVSLDDNAILYVDNVKNGDKISLSAAASQIRGNLVYEGDLLMGANKADREKGVLSFEMENQADLAKYGITGAGFGVIYAMYENGENVGNDNAVFFRNLVSTQTSAAYQQLSNGEYDWNAQTLNTILNDVAAIGATTGAQAVTMDAVNQMADTVAARTSILTQRAQGVNVWVDV